MAGLLLVLWDVDFTLVDAHGAGLRLYRLAFSELYGRELPEEVGRTGMAGRTDLAIALDVLAAAGITNPRSHVRRFEAAMTMLAPGVAEFVADSGKVLPGARAALEAIAALAANGEAIRQSVLTGNIRALAMAKLSPLGLTRYLDLNVGAYGDESERRAELVGLARARASKAYHADFADEATVLVGDTPLDVQAALATGARAVGVATGPFSPDELAEAGAHAVLPDLTSTDHVLTAVLGADYQPRSA